MCSPVPALKSLDTNVFSALPSNMDKCRRVCRKSNEAELSDRSLSLLLSPSGSPHPKTTAFNRHHSQEPTPVK